MKYLLSIVAALFFSMAQSMEQATQTIQTNNASLSRSISEKRSMAVQALPIFVPYFAFMGGLCGVAAQTAGLTDYFSDPASSFAHGAALGSAVAGITVNWLTDHI